MISVIPVLVRTTGVSGVVQGGGLLPNWVLGACDRAGLGCESNCVEIVLSITRIGTHDPRAPGWFILRGYGYGYGHGHGHGPVGFWNLVQATEIE